MEKPVAFTLNEIQALLPVLDAGVKAAGIQVFQNDGGVHLQAVLKKLQVMADEGAAKTREEDASEPDAAAA